MRRPSLSISFFVMATSIAVADASAQEATFTPLGLLPGGGAFFSLATGVSDDGQVVAGTVGVMDPLDVLPFIWTEATGMKEIDGRPPGVLHTEVGPVSADGSMVSGAFFFDDRRHHAFLWERGVGFRLLPYLPGGGRVSSANGIARDGKRIFGLSDTSLGLEAAIWDYPFDAPKGFGDLPGGAFYSGFGQSTPDGTAAAGGGTSARGLEAVLWREGQGFTVLGDLPGGRVEAGASGISADARVLTGNSNTTGGLAGAFRWTEASGMLALGALPGDSASGALATTADGAVVVGNSNRVSGSAIIETAVIWDRIRGMRGLKAVLEDDFGLDLTDWLLHRAIDITADGRFIVGQAMNPAGVREAYIVQIPAFCYADCDESTGHRVLDLNDFLEFQRRFALQDLYSDCDQNGAHDLFDFLCFQNAFAAGCP
ncbi:MAG: PEP-CTERM sorting domain-containing protein [Phycisphaerales bacterium JB039]